MLTFRSTGNPSYPYEVLKDGEVKYALFRVYFDGPKAQTAWHRLETIYGKPARQHKAQFWSYNPTDDVLFGADSSLRYQPGAKITRHT